MSYFIIKKVNVGDETDMDTIVTEEDIENTILKKPQYTNVSRDLLTPEEGDEIYNLDDHAPQYYNGSTWV